VASKRRQGLLRSGIRRAHFRECGTYLHEHLFELRADIERDLELPACDLQSVGLKVWVLPPWYYRLLALNRRARLSLADLSAVLLGWPRLALVGELRGRPAESSGTKWSIGKGLLSETIAHDSSKDMSVLIHARDWQEGIETLSKRDFRRLSGELRLGRKRKDFKRLRDVYGAAVSVDMIARDTYPPFGCITAHTARNHELSDDQAVICGDRIVASRSTIAQAILQRSHYKLPWS
jgi:hypothetical protein